MEEGLVGIRKLDLSFTSAFEERMWKTLIPRSRVIMARVAVIQ